MNLFGYVDIYHGLQKTKEIGGCVETAFIQLVDGTECTNAVITQVDYTGNRLYAIGFMDETGMVRVVNIDHIRLIQNPQHKKIKECLNAAYREWATELKSVRAKRLIEISKGALPSSYEKELNTIMDDIGIESQERLLETAHA